MFLGQDLYSREAFFTTYEQREIREALEKIRRDRQNIKKKKGFELVWEVGAIVSLHQPCKQAPFREEVKSRYLQPSSKGLFKVLSSCKYHTLIRNLFNGNISSVHPTELRKTDISEYKISWPDEFGIEGGTASFPSSFSSSGATQMKSSHYLVDPALYSQQLYQLPDPDNRQKNKNVSFTDVDEIKTIE